MTLQAQIDAIVDAAYAGHVASAVKRGRDPRFPYVPVIRFTASTCRKIQTSNPVKGRAFATRDGAVACAQQAIDAYRNHMRDTMLHPSRGRAWRRQYGLPENI